MRIGITASHLLQAGGGIKAYLNGLLPELARLEPQSEFVVIYPASLSLECFRRAPSFKAPNISRRWLPGPQRILHRAWRSLHWPPVEYFTGRLDLVHGTHFLLPPARTRRLVLTIHDLAELRRPDLFGSDAMDNEEYTWLLPYALPRALRVITPSESTARDLVALRGFPRDRIAVIPYGIDPSRWQMNPEEAAGILRQLGIGADFIFYNAGTMARRKNIERAVKAFRILHESMRSDIVLVIAAVGHAPPDVAATAVGEELQGRVRLLKSVTQKEAAALYRGCKVALYISEHEGFGLPALEALAAGAPLVASAISSIPEVVGDAAVLVDPTSEAAIAEAIGQIMLDERLSARLREAGPVRAGAFTWKRAAEQTMRVYREVLELDG